MNELTSLDYDKIKAGLEQEWDNIEFVTGERGKGMSTLAIHINRRTVWERLKDQLAKGLRWYDQHRLPIFGTIYAILGPFYLFIGLLNFREGFVVAAAIFITLSCMMYIVLGAAMMKYAHGGV